MCHEIVIHLYIKYINIIYLRYLLYGLLHSVMAECKGLLEDLNIACCLLHLLDSSIHYIYIYIYVCVIIKLFLILNAHFVFGMLFLYSIFQPFYKVAHKKECSRINKNW